MAYNDISLPILLPPERTISNNLQARESIFDSVDFIYVSPDPVEISDTPVFDPEALDMGKSATGKICPMDSLEFAAADVQS